MKRRDFLKTPGYFVAAAAIGGTAACGDDDPVIDAGMKNYVFPQDVASGDPRATSVVLWTRVIADDGSTDPVSVTAQVSTTDDFGSLVVEQDMEVDDSSDHTLRLLVTGLSPKTFYYYRFLAGEQQSITGRTLTAPDASDTAPVNLAWVSCQDYATGVHSAYRQLIIDDEARPEADRIQFILHLGDFIYETVDQGFQGAIDESFQPIEITDRNGEPRRVEPFPDGGQAGNTSYALTLTDYRHLYKQFLRDEDLRAARARWPFIHTWDDHEFSNDSWQTQANFIDGDSLDEPAQTRKVAANQAWFEYTACNLSDAEGVAGVTQHASDFSPAEVTDTPYSEVDANNLITEANNVAALETMTIYRSFRFGQHVELVVTDERSYRSDHPVPEDISQHLLFFHPRVAIPFELADVYDQGMTANGGNPPDTLLGTFPNPRSASPPGTMLGAQQKTWWKETMQNSDATWKVWGNSVPFTHVRATNNPPGVLLVERVMASDAWDGYNTERTELMQFIRDNNIQNLVVLTGDVHAHIASHLLDDFLAPNPQQLGAEFCAAGVSSNSLFSFFESASGAIGDATLRALVTYDSAPFGGDTAFVNNLNALFFYGSSAAQVQNYDIPAVEAAADPAANPHLKFIDTDAQGYGLLTVTADNITAQLVTIERPIVDNGLAGPGIKATATFTMDKDDPASLTDPAFTGVIPFPFTA